MEIEYFECLANNMAPRKIIWRELAKDNNSYYTLIFFIITSWSLCFIQNETVFYSF